MSVGAALGFGGWRTRRDASRRSDRRRAVAGLGRIANWASQVRLEVTIGACCYYFGCLLSNRREQGLSTHVTRLQRDRGPGSSPTGPIELAADGDP